MNIPISYSIQIYGEKNKFMNFPYTMNIHLNVLLKYRSKYIKYTSIRSMRHLILKNLRFIHVQSSEKCKVDTQI